MTRTVWVSGGTGFIGTHLVERLLREGCTVRCLVRREGTAADKLKELGADIIPGDLGRPDLFADSLKGVDWIFHLAAAYRHGATGQSEFARTNIQATAVLLDLAIRFQVKRFIYCSTVGVLGDCKDRALDETAAYNPHEAYGRSKVEAEKLVNAAHHERGLDTVIVRPVGVYGPGDWRLGKLFLSIARRRFAMIGSGQTRYQMTYVDDLIAGLWLAANSSISCGQTYIIGGRDVPTISTLCQEIARQLKVKLPVFKIPFWPVWLMALLCEGICAPLHISPPLFRRRLDFFSKTRWFDTQKAQKELGFSPRVTLSEGISRTIDWYRRQGILP